LVLKQTDRATGSLSKMSDSVAKKRSLSVSVGR
jgi:hypothetical protein